MVDIINAANNVAAGEGADDRSEGQKLLDRQLAARNRLRTLQGRLGDVKSAISGPGPVSGSAGQAGGYTASKTSFFEGLSLLTDEFERVAGELEASVEDLANRF